MPKSQEMDVRLLSPVAEGLGDEETKLEDGMALCLSGGGYRAMLFHLGALWRLNQIGYLPQLQRISSVSGGSITAAVLGMNWRELDFSAKGVARNFEVQVSDPIRRFANRTIDAGSILGGILTPSSISDKVANAYRKHLYGDTTLQDLPDEPRFVFNATNVQSAALWRFSKPYIADWRVGMIENPETLLAIAVCASSAFPPVLSPAELDLEPGDFKKGSGTDLGTQAFRHEAVLTDGGVYDNLGLETAWKRYRTILVSDGGGKTKPEEDPKRDWARHTVRVLEIVDNQVRCLRKRQLIGSFKTGARSGVYWGIRSKMANYSASSKLRAPYNRTLLLAQTPTRLKRLDALAQERLINWGYAVSDAGIRSWVDDQIPPPKGFPYPDAKV